MARVRIPPGSTPEQTAAELATIGVTMGQRLRDGTYRAYVRKDKMPLFLSLSGELSQRAAILPPHK